MGFIKAAGQAVGGTFGDQWIDFFVPDESNLTTTTAVTKAVQNTKNAGRGSNDKHSDNIITNNSKIIVPEGMALVCVQDGAFTGFCAEPGAYYWTTTDPNSQSFLAGNRVIASVVKQSWERFKHAGIPDTQQLAFYVNLKEIPGLRFGTQAPVYWVDAYLGGQISAMTRGTYSLMIIDPLAFLKLFVPAAYLQPGAKGFDFADINEKANDQLFTEVVGSLEGAFSRYCSDPSRGNSMVRIQGDKDGFAKVLIESVEENFAWSQRGLAIHKAALMAIEYDAHSRQLLEEATEADMRSMGNRANILTQKDIAEGFKNAGSNPDGGAMGMAFMGMGMNAVGGQGLFQTPQPQQGTQQVPMGQNPMYNAEQPQQAAAAPADDPIANAKQKLMQAKELLDEGLISEDDFNQLKSKLLGL